MIYLVMWKYDDGFWRTYTTSSLKSAILVYEFKKNIYDTVEFYQKTDTCIDLIIGGEERSMNDEIRYKTLVKYIEDWESIAFDLYTSKRDKYGEVDQEVSIAKGEWKVWNMLMLLLKDDRRLSKLALRYFGKAVNC